MRITTSESNKDLKASHRSSAIITLATTPQLRPRTSSASLRGTGPSPIIERSQDEDADTISKNKDMPNAMNLAAELVRNCQFLEFLQAIVQCLTRLLLMNFNVLQRVQEAVRIQVILHGLLDFPSVLHFSVSACSFVCSSVDQYHFFSKTTDQDKILHRPLW